MEKEKALSTLSPRELGIVTCVKTTGAMRRRFADLGLLPGARVACVGKSPLGDPAAYLIADAVIAIRRRDAAAVFVNTEDGACF